MKLWLVHYFDGDCDETGWYAGETGAEAEKAWKAEQEEYDNDVKEMHLHGIWQIGESFTADGRRFDVQLVEYKEAK